MYPPTIAGKPVRFEEGWRFKNGDGSQEAVELWAHVDLNHGPHPYQGCALTGLSYGPSMEIIEDGNSIGFP